MKYIDVSLVQEALDKAIDDQGAGHIDAHDDEWHCYYEESGEPSCIVGWVLHHAGLPWVRLTEQRLNFASWLSVMESFDVEGDEKVLDWLNLAQFDNDSKVTWGFIRQCFHDTFMPESLEESHG